MNGTQSSSGAPTTLLLSVSLLLKHANAQTRLPTRKLGTASSGSHGLTSKLVATVVVMLVWSFVSTNPSGAHETKQKIENMMCSRYFLRRPCSAHDRTDITKR